MNETEARRVWLLRAFESPLTPPWTAEDAAWATREAARREGAAASDERFLAARAGLALQRLEAQGVQGMRTSPWRWMGALLVLAAFIAGAASSSVGPDGRISILAPPLLGLIAWNVAVYAVLLAVHLVPRARSAGPLRTALAATLQRWTQASAGPALQALRLRHAADWALAARSLHAQRAAAWLHAAAALFAVGALAALYVRGLAFEYRAGWDSTFLTPAAVRRLVAGVLGPASMLAGIGLPDVAGIASLRFSNGAGENAARWIHLYALTVAGIVLLPRLVLAAVAARAARREAESFALPFGEPYFQRLLQARSGQALELRVVPYSHRPSSEALGRLRAAIERACGRSIALDVGEPVAQGDEEDAVDDRPPGVQRVALTSLSATPERETHGRFLQTLHPRLLLLDEQGFGERFGAERLAERRSAWRRMLHELALPVVFIDLASGESEDDQALAAALEPPSQ